MLPSLLAVMVLLMTGDFHVETPTSAIKSSKKTLMIQIIVRRMGNFPNHCTFTFLNWQIGIAMRRSPANSAMWVHPALIVLDDTG